MAIEYSSDEMLDKYGLTEEQKKACKAVYLAMRKASYKSRMIIDKELKRILNNDTI